MGIDIYLEWAGKDAQAKDDQIAGFSTTDGHVGYLREAYHGGPYATQILVKEAFDAKECRAQIPAAVMRKRLTVAAPAAKGCNGGHAIAQLMANAFKAVGATDSTTPEEFIREKLSAVLGNVDNLEIPESVTADMSVEDAIRQRCANLYPDDGADYAQEVIQSFRDFVELAERREKETGEPCTIYASY